MPQQSRPEQEVAPAKVSQPSLYHGTSFLDLPTELRLQVYGYLLPVCDNRGRLRHKLICDGSPSSTNFMASCRQVYEEAAEVLYGSGLYTISLGCCELEIGTGIEFLDHHIKVDETQKLHSLTALRYIKHLTLKISASNHYEALCDVQDSIFLCLRALDLHHHQLRSITVKFDIEVNQRRAVCSDLSLFVRRPYNSNTFKLKMILPFLVDPLRAWRQMNPAVSLFQTDFNRSDSANPIPELVSENKSIFTSPKKFFRYYRCLRRLMSGLVGRDIDKAVLDVMVPPLSRLSSCRVFDDLQGFRQSHDIFQTLLRGRAISMLRSSPRHSSAQSEALEARIMWVSRRAVELDDALPREAVSDQPVITSANATQEPDSQDKLRRRALGLLYGAGSWALEEVVELMEAP